MVASALLAGVASATPSGAAAPTAAAPAKLVFVSERTGTRQVYAVRPDGRGLVQLTFGGDVEEVDLSRDGRRLAFVSGGRIWTARSDGQDPLALAEGSAPRWSPDSRRLAFAAPDGLWVATLPSRALGRVATGLAAAPAWSADGRTLAFLRGPQLVTLRAGRELVVAADAAPGGRVEWSPNGRWIAYADALSRVVTVRADGRARRVIAPGSQPAWSPDGRRLAFVEQGIRVATVATRRVRVLTRDSALGPALSRDPRWLPDGRLAFLYRRSPAFELRTVTQRGRPRVVPVADPMATALEVERPSPRLRYRAADPVGPVVVEGELRLRAPVSRLAMDGGRVAYASCGEAGVWDTASGGIVVGRREAPLCETSNGRVYALAVAGGRLAWGTTHGGIGVVVRLAQVDLARPRAEVEIATGGGCCVPDAGLPVPAWLLGGGATLAFSVRLGCEAPDYCPPVSGIREQTVWRADPPGTAGACPHATSMTPGLEQPGPCRRIASAEARLEPLDLDAGRLVVLRGDGAVALLDAAGAQLLEVPYEPGAVQGAALAGDDLAVLVAGAVEHRSAENGALLHAWPLGADLTPGGFCDRFCRPADLRVGDAARGLLAYVAGGRVGLLRLRDGARADVAAGTAVRLSDAGLAYAYEAEGEWRGRVRFVPFASLPLSP